MKIKAPFKVEGGLLLAWKLVKQLYAVNQEEVRCSGYKWKYWKT